MSDSAAIRSSRGGPLLGPSDPPPWSVYHGVGTASILLACDHASNRVPTVLDGLGIPPPALERHIGWDLGAGYLTRELAILLDAPAVLAGYSRLVVDVNRHPDDPTAFLPESDGQPVPANSGLSAAEREERVAAIFRPYHAEIERRLDQMRARGVEPALISIHSFTPQMDAVDRPWHVGVLWDVDPRIPEPLLAALRARGDYCIGDNEPYSGRHPADYTIDRHAERAGLPHVCLEVRQDLLAEQSGVERMARVLATALHPILADPALYRLRAPVVAEGNANGD
jgi:predicted N-formylglutamate amidohydrolase